MAKKRATSRTLTLKAVRTALEKSVGNISAAARALGTSRTAVYYYIDTRPELRQMVQDQREAVADVAETALYQACLRGEPWAVTMALRFSTRGKERGYGNTQEIEVAGGIDVKHDGNEHANAAVSAMARWLERNGLQEPVAEPDGST
jgi:AcrR family transcriptional regulator